MRSLMSKTPPIDNLAPRAKAGLPILHDGTGDRSRGRFPVSRKDPKPVMDFIVSHQR
jgi:hypothetical protein